MKKGLERVGQTREKGTRVGTRELIHHVISSRACRILVYRYILE